MSTAQLGGGASGTGSLLLQAPNTNSAQTVTFPDATGNVVIDSATQTLTNKTIQGGTITSGTLQASTSGTSITFTGIPSWAKRITVMFNGVSTTGSSTLGIRLGTASGIVSTGYNGSAADLVNTGTVVSATDTTVLLIGAGSPTQSPSSIRYGMAIISLIDSSTNTWVHTGSLGFSNTSMTTNFGGRIALSGVLTQLSITSVAGADTFDAGSINILYE